jgi:hypothetical protein
LSNLIYVFCISNNVASECCIFFYINLVPITTMKEEFEQIEVVDFKKPKKTKKPEASTTPSNSE